jgi:hypothetical protein
VEHRGNTKSNKKSRTLYACRMQARVFCFLVFDFYPSHNVVYIVMNYKNGLSGKDERHLEARKAGDSGITLENGGLSGERA